MPEPWQRWYIHAFHDLSSCRPTGDYTSRIPWDRIVLYGELHGLELDNIFLLVDLLREMDLAYRDWIEESKPKKDQK